MLPRWIRAKIIGTAVALARTLLQHLVAGFVRSRSVKGGLASGITGGFGTPSLSLAPYHSLLVC